VKVKKVWMYLYRVVYSAGNALDFLLSATRDAQAAKRFFSKTLAASHTIPPRVITVDKNAAYPKAFHQLQEEGILPTSCALRYSTYLTTLLEQDHRTHETAGQGASMGFISCETAWRTDAVARK
jgi:transposase-like protein